MGMISVCLSYFLVEVDTVVVVVEGMVVVTLAVVLTVDRVTTVVLGCAVVGLAVVDVMLGLAVQATLPAWSHVISEAE